MDLLKNMPSAPFVGQNGETERNIVKGMAFTGFRVMRRSIKTLRGKEGGYKKQTMPLAVKQRLFLVPLSVALVVAILIGFQMFA